MKTAVGTLVSLALMLRGALATEPAPAHEYRGAQFIQLELLRGSQPGELSDWVSREIATAIQWNELVASWNAPSNAVFKVEVRARCKGEWTRYYCLGEWALDSRNAPRTSVPDQHDEKGEVRTDILALSVPATSFQVRVVMPRPDNLTPVRFLGVTVVDSRVSPPGLDSSRAAWGTILNVPARSQTDYPEGVKKWCSPTSTSMLLAWWGVKLNRPELDMGVPDVAAAVYDPKWLGTGNWPFNTALAGAQPGLKACITRLTDVVEIEELIALEIPVAVSVSYDVLKGKERTRHNDGHIIVIVGFTSDGDVVANDPGVSRESVRRVFPREDFRRAWGASLNTTYLVWPEHHDLPANRWGHLPSK